MTTELDVRRGVQRWLIREISGVFIVASLLFSAAGRLDWPMGWALVALYVLWVAANAWLLIPRSPELLVERIQRRFSTKTWDNVILVLYGLLAIVKYVIAGLDYRFAWSVTLPAAVQVSAWIVAALGYTLVTWAMTANAFFALANRIQTERGHTVVTSGPYRYVRHPGYLGSIVFELATPIMLGSLWALIPGGLAAVAMLVRTGLEDRALCIELPGYVQYTQQTQWRLLPGVW